MANLSVLVFVVLFAVFVKEGEPVRCWTCSSDINAACGDPFIPGRSENYLFRLENCDASAGATYPYLTSSKSVCKKQKKYINGEVVITRGCTWKRQDDHTVACPSSSNGPNEVMAFCETCDYDACNGAGTIGRTLALLIAPLGLLLFK